MASQPGSLRDVDDLVDAEVALGGRRGADRVGLVGHAHVERGAIDLGVDATAAMPISWSVRVTRTAISPRFATRTFLKGGRAVAMFASDRYPR